MKRAWSDGTVAIDFSALELVERLASIVPPPGKNQVLYHGVLAARSAWRSQVVPGRRELSTSEVAARAAVVLTRTPSASKRPRWTPWEQLLYQAFEVRSRACPECGERMQLRSVVMG